MELIKNHKRRPLLSVKRTFFENDDSVESEILGSGVRILTATVNSGNGFESSNFSFAIFENPENHGY